MSSIHPFRHPKLDEKPFLEKDVLDLFFERLVVPKWLIFKAFQDLRGAKMAQNGLKIGSFQSFVPQMVEDYLQKNTFSTHF